jgi:hypothetical protein
VQRVDLTGRPGKRIPVSQGGLALTGEHERAQQVQPVLPFGDQQGGGVVARQRPVAARIARVTLSRGQRRGQLVDL